jgi:putative oxidoreductase
VNATPSLRRRVFEVLTAGPSSGPRATLAWLLRVASGAVFLIFGLAKFTSHGAEVDSFQSYGLPSPDTFVYVIGTLEVIGALFLFAGFATRFTALVLAGNMAAAIVVSGLGEGEVISLTLAPALLVSMLFLIWVGPGRHALDHRLRGSAPPG